MPQTDRRMSSDRESAAPSTAEITVEDAFARATSLDGPERASYLAELKRADERIFNEVVSLIPFDGPGTLIEHMPERLASETIDGGAAKTIADAGSPTVRIDGPPGRLAAARRSIVSIDRSRLRRWALLLIPAVSILIGSVLAVRVADRELRSLVERQLTNNLDHETEALTVWVEAKGQMVSLIARDPAVVKAVSELVARGLVPDMTAEKFASDPAHETLELALAAALGRREGLRYTVWDRDWQVIAAWDRDPRFYGAVESDSESAQLTRVFRGQAEVFFPTDGSYAEGDEFKTKPKVAFTVPVRNESDRIIAALGVGGLFQEEFEALMRPGDQGRSGETYAVNSSGLMISQSRFFSEVQSAGLVSPEETSTSMVVRVAAPDGPLRESGNAVDPTAVASWPLTKVARELVAGRSGVSLDPYLGYRGVPVVGAWRWLDEYRIGLVAEMERDDAFVLVDSLKKINRVVLALTAASVALILIAGWGAWRTKQKEAARPRIGPYALKSVLGEGGMGRVYRGEHDLLCRPTAVKVLKPEAADELATARFEREVRLASSLESPHTIEIFDYGRTDAGQFYCAMALLSGITFRQLVSEHGPVSADRAVYLLKQVCLSLTEAHEKGLVHRDIKPANIMVCDRGGQPDWVLVLDFGLAKEQAPSASAKVTNTTMLLGTPDFIPPERIRQPGLADPRSDLYAVGVVAYFLLTGRPAFETTGQLDALEKALYFDPPPVSEHAPHPIPQELERIIMDCLLKDPDQRPQSASEMYDRLDAVPAGDQPWGVVQARAWWESVKSP